MRWSEFFHQNKNFVISLLGGAILFFLCFYFINTIFDQVEAIQTEIRRSHRAVEQNLEKLTSKKGLAYQRGLYPILEKKVLPEAKKNLLYNPHPKYLWNKKEKNPSFYFSTLKARLERQLALMADTFSFSYSGLGFTKTEFTQENIQDYLNRLDLLEKILIHAMKSKIQKIESIESELERVSYPIPGTRYEMIATPIRLVAFGSNKELLSFLAPFNQRKTENLLPHLELIELTMLPTGSTGVIQAKILFYALQLGKLDTKVEKPEGRASSSTSSGWGRRSLIRRMR